MKLNNIKKVTIVIVFIMVLSTIVVAKFTNILKPADTSSSNNTPSPPPLEEPKEGTPIEQNPQDSEEIPEPITNNEPVEEQPNQEPPIKETPVVSEINPVITDKPSNVESVLGVNDKKDTGEKDGTSKKDVTDKLEDNERKNEKDIKNSSEDKSNDRKNIIKSSYITEEKAIEIALKKMGNKAKLIEIDENFKSNPPIYELEIAKNKFIYKLEIHAKTGAILGSEKTKVK